MNNLSNFYIVGQSESIPWYRAYIHCNFCINLHVIMAVIKQVVSGCFFSEHSLSFDIIVYSQTLHVLTGCWTDWGQIRYNNVSDTEY